MLSSELLHHEGTNSYCLVYYTADFAFTCSLSLSICVHTPYITYTSVCTNQKIIPSHITERVITYKITNIKTYNF